MNFNRRKRELLVQTPLPEQILKSFRTLMSKMESFTSKTIMRLISSDDLSGKKQPRYLFIRGTALLTRTLKLSLGHQFIKHNKTFKHLQFSETSSGRAILKS